MDIHDLERPAQRRRTAWLPETEGTVAPVFTAPGPIEAGLAPAPLPGATPPAHAPAPAPEGTAPEPGNR